MTKAGHIWLNHVDPMPYLFTFHTLVTGAGVTYSSWNILVCLDCGPQITHRLRRPVEAVLQNVVNVVVAQEARILVGGNQRKSTDRLVAHWSG